MSLERHRIENISELIAVLKLTPRQIQECFRVLGHMLSTTQDKRGSLLWCVSVASIAMSALRIGRPDAFHKLGTQSFTPIEAIHLLKDELKLQNYDWWFTMFATGQGIAFKEGQTLIDVFKEVGLLSGDADLVPGYFSQWGEGWGRSHESRIRQTHQRIEVLRSFLWSEGKFATEEENSGSVVFEVSEASGIGFDGLDFGVDPFRDGVGDVAVVIGQNVG